MTYYMFLDDERDPPEDGRTWVIVRSSIEAIELVKQRGFPEFISFDHDLSGTDTSMVFVRWVQAEMVDRNQVRTFSYYVHSQNPVGRDNIIGAWDSFDRYMGSVDN